MIKYLLIAAFLLGLLGAALPGNAQQAEPGTGPRSTLDTRPVPTLAPGATSITWGNTVPTQLAYPGPAAHGQGELSAQAQMEAAAPPTVQYRAGPNGKGIVIAVQSVAPEVSVLQRRSDREWVCEGGHIEYWYEGDTFAILEVWRDSTGVEAQRKTAIAVPRFKIAIPIVW